jgi:thioesterase domain-containing protein
MCAFEIARVLAEAGDEVGLLCIIDTPLVQPEWHGVYREHADKTRRAMDVLAASPEGQPPSAELLAAMAEVDLEQEALTFSHAGVRKLLMSILRSASSLTDYAPKPVDCDLLLYEADGTAWPDPLCDTWLPAVRDIQYRLMPGRHGAPLSEPHARTVADDIAEIIGRHSGDRNRTPMVQR